MTGTAALAAAVGFMASIFSARALGPELRGEVAFVLQLSYFIAPIICVSADRATLRKNGAQTTDFFTPSRIFLLAATAMVLCAFLVVDPSHAVVAPITFTTAWFILRRADVIRSKDVRSYVRPFVVYQGALLVASVALYLLNVREWIWWAAVYAVPIVWSVFMKPTASNTKPTLRRITANGPLVVANLSQMFSTRGQRLLLPIFSNSAQLGLFTIIATATEPIFWMAQALADHRVSADTQPAGTGARLRRLIRDTVIFTPLSVMIGAILWVLLVPIFGALYAGAHAYIIPLSLANIVLAAYRQTSAWILAGDQPGRIGTLESTTALAAIAVYPLAIWLAGGLGAAWGSLIVYATGLLIGLIICSFADQRREHIS